MAKLDPHPGNTTAPPLPSGSPQRSQADEDGVLQGDRLLSSASAMEEPHQQHPNQQRHHIGLQHSHSASSQHYRVNKHYEGQLNSAAGLKMPDKVLATKDLVTSVSHPFASNCSWFCPSCYLLYICQLTSKHCQEALPVIWVFQGKLELLLWLRRWTLARCVW